MASFYMRKDSPYFWIRFRTAAGKWKSKSSGIKHGSTNAKARVARITMEMTGREQIEAGEAGASFACWVAKWMAYKYQNPKTLHRYQNAWTAIEDFMRRRRIEHPGEVTYEVCHDFLRWRSDRELAAEEDRRAVTWNTALTEVRVMGAVMQEAVRRGYVSANPTARLGVARRDTKQKREITEEEIRVIEAGLENAPEWMRDSWKIYMFQGCRMAEVEVPLDRVDHASGAITFKLKGGRMHTTAMHRQVGEIARRRASEGEKLLVKLPKSPSKDWIKFFRSVGIEGISIHCTRITAITRLARAGLSEVQTMEYIGHCSAEVHAIYRRFRACDLRHVGEALG